MNVSAPNHNAQRRMIWVSRLALIVGVVALLFVAPLGYSPVYYVVLASIGVLPLFCGPTLYRWLGCVFVVASLAFAVQQYRSGVAFRAQIKQLKAEAEAQQRLSETP